MDQPTEDALRRAGVNMERLREFAPGFASAIERVGLGEATRKRLGYVALSPRLHRDLNPRNPRGPK